MQALTYRPLPDVLPANLVSVGVLAEENGWQTWTTYVPGNITLRLAKPGVPRIWATWQNKSFWRAYAQTAQRLSLSDLRAVLRDPALLEQDPDDPFGNAEVSPPDGSM